MFVASREMFPKDPVSPSTQSRGDALTRSFGWRQNNSENASMKIRMRLNLRFIACVVVAGVALGVGVHFVHGYQVKRNAGALLRMADKAKEDKDEDKEMQYLSRYLGFVPEDIDARARYGEQLDERAKKSGSLRGRMNAYFTLDAVLRRDPKRRDIRRRQADTAMALGKFDEALVHLKSLHETAPADADLERLMGRCEEALGQVDKALAAYQLAVRHASTRIDNYVRAAVLLRERLDKSKEADALMDAMVEANPKSSEAYLTRSRYRLQFEGKSPSAVEGAKKDVAEARKLAPDDPDVVRAAADVARAQGETDEARAVLHQGIAAHPREARLYSDLIALEVGDDKAKEALKVVRQGLKELPDNSDLLRSLADLLIQSGELEEAEAVIVRLRDMKYAPPLLDYLQARIHVRKGEWNKASVLLDRVRPQLTRLPALEMQAWLLSGQCHEQLGNPDQALSAYQQARKLDPLSAATHYRLGSILMALNRNDEAVAQFRDILASPKPPPGMHALLARALIVRNARLPLKNRELGEIKRELALAEKETPDALDLPVLQAEALLLENVKNAETARKRIEKACEAHPNEASLWIALAQLSGRDEALRVLDRAAARPKLAERVELRLARLSYLMQPLAEAKTPEARKKAAEQIGQTLTAMEKDADTLAEADRPRLLNGLADARRRLGDDADAERLWKQVADMQPNNLGIRLVLFDLALLANQPAEVERRLAEIRGIEGENGSFWRYAEAARRIQQARPKDKEELSDSGRRQLREARQYLTEAGNRRTSWPRIPALEAEIDELEGRIPAAIEKYQQAVALGERRPAIIRRMVQLLFEQRRFDEANAAVSKLLDQENTLLLAGLGKLAAQSLLSKADPTSGDSERAVDLALKSVSPDSKSYQDHLWLGRILWATGKPTEQKKAEKELRRACELDDKAAETWVTLVAFLSANGKKKEAENAIEQATKKLPSEQAPLALAACYENIGDPKKAEEYYSAALKATPDDTAMLRNVAAFHLRHGDLGKAEPRLRTILDLGSKASSADLPWARRALAASLASNTDRRRFEEALELIEKNLSDNKDSKPDQHAKALLLATRLSRRKEAIHLFEDLARRDTLPAVERFALVKLYLTEDNWPQAQLHMLTLLASPDGKNPNYEAYYARRLLQRGDINDAQAQLTKLEKALPDAPLTREIKARVLQAKGKDAEAMAVIQEYARHKDADLARAGLLLETLGQQSKAKDLYRREAQTLYRKYVGQSDKPERYLTLAGFYGRQHDLKEALASCDQALQHKAAPETVAQSLTGILRENAAGAEPCRRVEKTLKEMLKQAPDSVTLLVCLADVYDLQERFDEAEQIYRQALRKDADNVMILNNLAWLLAFKKPAPRDEALKAINQAIDRVGPSPELLDTRGVVHLMLAQNDRAVEDLQTALSQAPSANRSFHLARALASLNKPREARQVLEDATKRGFDVKTLHPLEKPFGEQLLASLRMN
jgi:tetratricopeptide (TPR) repeat protein